MFNHGNHYVIVVENIRVPMAFLCNFMNWISFEREHQNETISIKCLKHQVRSPQSIAVDCSKIIQRSVELFISNSLKKYTASINGRIESWALRRKTVAQIRCLDGINTSKIKQMRNKGFICNKAWNEL